MSIRQYRRPIPIRFSGWRTVDGVRLTPPTPEFEDVFVILEEPLLEFTHDDLYMLRCMQIDPFTEVQ